VSHPALQNAAKGVDRGACFPDQGGPLAEDRAVRPAPAKAAREDRGRAHRDGGRDPLVEGENEAKVPGVAGKRTGGQGPRHARRKGGRRFDHFQMARPRGFEPLAT
jgi:hypothetical protein